MNGFHVGTPAWRPRVVRAARVSESGNPGRGGWSIESGWRGGITRLPLSPGWSPRPSLAKSARDSPRLLPRKPAEPGGKSRLPRGGDGEPRRARGGDGEPRRPRCGDGEARRPRSGDGDPRRPRGGDGEARRPRCPDGERGRRAGVRDEEEQEDGGEVRRAGPEEEPELRPVRGSPPPLSLGRCEETEERAPLRYMVLAAAATAAAPTWGRPGRGPPARRRSCNPGRHGRRAPPPQPEQPPPLSPTPPLGPGRARPRGRDWRLEGASTGPTHPPALRGSPFLHSGSGQGSQKWGGARRAVRGWARGGEKKRATCAPHAPPPSRQDGGR